MKILVSGVGGDIGFTVGRILRRMGLVDSMLVGVDSSNDHPAKAIFDKVALAPSAADHPEHFIEWLDSFIFAQDIDLFVPTTESEILALSSRSVALRGSSKVMINSPSIVRSCVDKLVCLQTLSEIGLSVGQFGLVGIDLPARYPVVVKPRFGRGSRGVVFARSESEFQQYLQSFDQGVEEALWQDSFEPTYQEYTCSIYAGSDGEIRLLQLRRRLKGGLTYKAEILNVESIAECLLAIVGGLDFFGCINVQLILTEDGPRVFEINPRLSSTVGFRDRVGFCDFRWWMSDILGLPRSDYVAPREGLTMYRVLDESVLW